MNDFFSPRVPRHRVDLHMPHVAIAIGAQAINLAPDMRVKVRKLAQHIWRRETALRTQGRTKTAVRDALVLYLSHQIDCVAFYRRHEEALQYFEVAAPMV